MSAVIPVQAGIHFETCDNFAAKAGRLNGQWFPACAGMTAESLSLFVQCALLKCGQKPPTAGIAKAVSR